MKNDQKEKQSAGNKQSMTWPDSKDKQMNKQRNQQQTGNSMSIGNDPATADNSGNSADTDPEINAPIYDPQKTIKKIPVMKEDSGKPE
jgi:hypothetical protein